MLPPPSFGDIVTAANLVCSIYKALSDSAGSSYEYQCLIEELRSFERALRTVDHVITMTPPSGDLAQGIAQETRTCLALLNAFYNRIQKYQKALGRDSKGTASWRKIGWSLFKAGEVASLREKLSQHKQNIVIFLTSLDIIVAGIYAEETRQISASVNEGFLAIQKRLPRSVGYGDGNVVTLINPFGERLPLLWEYCFSEDRLHETLMTYFKGKLGEGHVERHDYSISTEDGKALVQSNNWGSVVKKGNVFVMSMIVKKVALHDEYARRQRNVCPRCYDTQIGVMPDEGWLQCRRCEKRFRCAEWAIEQSQPPPQEENVADFRNIHVVLVEKVRKPFKWLQCRLVL